MFETTSPRRPAPGAATAFILCAASTVLLAACGGGGGQDPATSSATATSLAGAGNSTSNNGANSTTGTTTGSTTTTTTTGTTTTTTTGTSGTTTTGTTNTGTTNTSTGGNTTTGSTGGSATPSTVTIDYYGDSTVWGYKSGVGGQVAVPAPSAFAGALPKTTNYVVRNEGVSGTTACQLLNGTDGKHPQWDVQLANSNANIVIVNHAINDEWKMDLATYQGCLTSLAQKARQAGKKIIFETPNPTRDSYPAGLDTWAQAMRDVAHAQGAPVIDQYQYLKDYLAGASPLTICPDGLHPTDAVYIMKGQYAARVFPTLGL